MSVCVLLKKGFSRFWLVLLFALAFIVSFHSWSLAPVIRLPTTWPFKKSPDALNLLIPVLAQKHPETFLIAKYSLHRTHGETGPVSNRGIFVGKK